MKKASITEAKNRLSALIAGLKSGSPVLIVDRGHPVARLEPVTSEPELRPRWPAVAADSRRHRPAGPHCSPARYLPINPPDQKQVLRRSQRSLRNAEKDGEILGRFGDRAATGRRSLDAPSVGSGRRGPCDARVVGFRSRIRLRTRTRRARSFGQLRWDRCGSFSARTTQGRWHEIDPSDAVRKTAARFVRVHPLRAADALQLAAAFAAAEGRPPSLELITLDDRLRTAARKEGFAVVEIASTD